MSIAECRLSNAEGDRLVGARIGRRFAGAAVVVATFGILCGARLWRPDELFTITENIQIGEAQAWWSGRLDLPERKWDSALFNGKVYSHFPPMFSIVAAMIVPVFGGVPHWLVVLLLMAPVPLLAYALFLRLTHSAVCSAVLGIGFVCGTSALPVLDKTLRGCPPYSVNQTLATIGTLLFLFEFFGRRRVWLAGIGVAIAVLSRQLCAAYLIPLVWMAWNPVPIPRNDAATPHAMTRSRFRRLAGVAVVVLAVTGIPMALNTAKFGHPFDSGYMRIYEGREDDSFVRDARARGLFSTHYLVRNLKYANFGIPELHGIEMAGRGQWYLRPNPWGTGIWWTTPLLLFLFADARRLLAEPASRALLGTTGIIFVALMLYHSTGYEQRGFNRYSLDYLPALFGILVPGCIQSFRRKWLSVVLVAWSVLYFAVLLPRPNIRVW